jgi:hypothetical protein
MNSKLKIAFINPPHADWSLANNLTYLLCQSHYNHKGKYPDKVEWLPAPYKWDKYETYEEVYKEVKDADIILFSSYVWNYPIVDNIARLAKHDGKITALGGPHIGTNEPDFLSERSFYDLICQPMKPGEVFVEDLINSFIENNGNPKREDIAWELKSTKGRVHDLGLEDYSVYEDHLSYLKETNRYAVENDLEQFIAIETTRGCPYKCVFCEWGGGINTKIYKKDIKIVKRDILAMKEAGYSSAYLTDANFGAFFERDLEIFRTAWELGFNLTDISTMKSKAYERRKALIDAWFDIVGQTELDSASIVPTVSIQSISDEAMEVAKRVDMNFKDKIRLSEHINKRCREEKLPIPALELILAMPGSTIDDFYREMEIIWNFQAWGSYRHDYMFLPDSDLNSKEYKEKYDIKTVEVFTDIADEDGIDNINSLYKGRQSHFRTILSCYSYTEEELKEMWFMNNAANYMLQHWYKQFINELTVYQFAKMCYNIIIQLDSFEPIKQEIDDIFDCNTPPRSIRQLGGKFRVDTIQEFLKDNRVFIISEVMSRCFAQELEETIVAG